MGIKIGEIGTAKECETTFRGIPTPSKEAYMTLGKNYAFEEIDEVDEFGVPLVLFKLDYKMYWSEQALIDGQPPLICNELMRFATYEGRIDFKITIVQMLTMTITEIIRLKLGEKIFEFVPEWTNGTELKLVDDF